MKNFSGNLSVVSVVKKLKKEIKPRKGKVEIPYYENIMKNNENMYFVFRGQNPLPEGHTINVSGRVVGRVSLHNHSAILLHNIRYRTAKM